MTDCVRMDSFYIGIATLLGPTPCSCLLPLIGYTAAAMVEVMGKVWVVTIPALLVFPN